VDAGEVLYVAFGIGRYYADSTLVHARNRMAEYIDRLLPQRQITVKAPKCLEVTVWRQKTPERVIIHLANRTALAHDMPRLHEIPALCEVTIEFESPYPASTVTCRGAYVTTTVDGSKLRVQLASLDVYAALLINPAERA
jgi:hypothetical protein